jgi:prepilin-type N-terminal cleavage/methylation domain-containing protein
MDKKRQHEIRRSGFTLVEIMIVVGILGLLSVLSVPAFAKARRNSLNQKCVLNQRAIRDAVIRYEMDYATTLYPYRNNGAQIRNLFLQGGYMNPINNFDCPNSQTRDYDDYQLVYTNGTDFLTVHCTILPDEHVLP